MSFRTIRSAQQAIWPRVWESLERHRHSRKLVADNPKAHGAAARSRANVPWNRVVANETIWAIAKADLLNTPEQADVLTAARAWAKSWQDCGPPSSSTDDQTDIDLYNAVQKLASFAEIPDEAGV